MQNLEWRDNILIRSDLRVSQRESETGEHFLSPPPERTRADKAVKCNHQQYRSSKAIKVVTFS